MANGRNFTSKKFRGEKIHGGFSPIPWDVLDSKSYLALSHTSRSLLLELARQVLPDNNGRLLLTSKYLSKRGWRSAGVISRAKRELLDAELIYEIKPVGLLLRGKIYQHLKIMTLVLLKVS
jgi:hypothetical protein